MKKIILFILFFHTALSIDAQKKDTILHSYWENGKIKESKSGYIEISENGDSSFVMQGERKKWYKNGQLWYSQKFYGEGFNRIGNATYWRQNGKIEMEISIISYDTTWQLLHESCGDTTIRGGLVPAIANFKYYYENGKLRNVLVWDESSNTATQFMRYRNGNLQVTGKIEGRYNPCKRLFLKIGDWVYFNKKNKQIGMEKFDANGNSIAKEGKIIRKKNTKKKEPWMINGVDYQI